MTMGPRQMTGLSSSTRNPIDMTLRPCASRGLILFSSSAMGRAAGIPSIRGWLGPYMSASSTPTFAPSLLRASATFTATVDLPTPPFPLAMAMMFFTPATSILPAIEGRAVTWLVTRTFTEFTFSKEPTASLHSCSNSSLRGCAGVVNCSVKATASPQICTSLIMLRLTRSFPTSGSRTFFRASIIWASVASAIEGIL